MWTESQKAYLAGIIDGEGCFYINPSYRHRIYVVNTDERLIKWLQINFGGLIYQRKSKKNPHWKTKFEWIPAETQTKNICEAIIPYLICKKDQAELMIKFRKSFKDRSTSYQSIINFRFYCRETMKKLNHRIPLSL